MNWMLRKDQYRERRIFKDSNIQEAIDAALEHVSEDKPVAAVAHATPIGQRISLAVRVNGEWSISVAAYRAKGPMDKWDLGAGAEVVWTP
jgi:hypothetical protein